MGDRFPAAFTEKYKAGRVIGEGNFSIVKECIRKSDGSRFAVKCINKSALNPKDRSNLVQEINILKELDHPNIIKLFDVYEDDRDMCYLVMEFAAGGELFDRIIAKEYYTEAEAKRVVKVVAKVLAYCHAEGVTHRDLKPENLLYADESEDAKIKIADFGFAKLVTAETNMSTMCGTPGYYAPEIVRKQPYDNKCDIWSLGVITYILLCGFPPFYDENQVEEMRKILHGEFEFVAPYFDGVSSLAKDLIKRMLVVDASKRLSAEQVLKHAWFQDMADDDDKVLDSVAKNLKEAKRLTTRSRFRASVGAVMAVKKTQRLLSMKQGRAPT
ncbi:hypothetical protein Poli38472_011582 [Pythium oligandrum]|uniref:non-specific serine/threonine protein kinase n=1 Tax=Pythium oligandrum TaxID=41045 RepID=A0A8K1CJN9_PYTOL|nr:hypothetical protein Poli38472_011582 [Pythium oligandrum]|eukprot:TMW64702.1 hypothetical protein Poli38472_011582 [Pythium oligandrum]